MQMELTVITRSDHLQSIICYSKLFQLAEHLSSYESVWKRNANIRGSLLTTEDQRREIDREIQEDLARPWHLNTIQFNPTSLSAPQNTATLLPSISASIPVASTSEQGQKQSTLLQFLKSSNVQNAFSILSPSSAEPSTLTVTNSTQQRKRHCRRCGKVNEECQGAMSVKNCRNPCQDCGALNCEGRDPRNWKNGKTCANTGEQNVLQRG
jgi:hypothetical protein